MKQRISTIIIVGILLFQSLSAYPLMIDAVENSNKTTLQAGDTYSKVFPDAALAQVIAKAATGSEDTTQLVNQADLNKIIILTANGKSIADVTGMDLLVKATTINLNNNQITDAAPLTQLPNLVKLDLSDNQISTITLNAENQLPKLTTLDIQNNPTLTVIDIEDQPKLVNVYTPKSAGFINLTTVIAKNNPQLLNMGYFGVEGIYYGNIPTLTKVEMVNLPKVTALKFEHSKIKNAVLDNLPSVTAVRLQNNMLESDSIIQNIPKLTNLNLFNNKLTDIDMLKGLPAVTSMDISFNSLRVLPKDLPTIMPNLKILTAGSQVTVLEKIVALDDLVLDNNVSNMGTIVKPTSISDRGTYANNQITWSYKNLEKVSLVSYEFNEPINMTGVKGSFTGVIRQPVKASTVPIISTDAEIRYPQRIEKTEAEFLSDIQAQTNDETPVTSNFEAVVNLKKVGKYVVTISAVNVDGVKAIPKEVTVYVDPVQAANVTVQYEDTSKKKIAESVILTGYIGEDYHSSAKEIAGYTLTETPANAEGGFSAEEQSVTYVYSKDIIPAANITVQYVDVDGNELAPSEILLGNIDEEYHSSAKEIAGYTLTETPANAQGEFSAEEQTVTYVYSKDPVPAANITVQYVDEAGNELAASEILLGNIGEDYHSSAKEIPSYTLTKTPANAEGEFSAEEQTVTYVYSKIPVPAADITVQYVDEAGNELVTSDILSGNIGDDYMATAKEIAGYALIETPSNAAGQFSETSQTVTYVYRSSKNEITPAKDITVKYIDEHQNELAMSEVLSGGIGETYSTEPKEIQGYTLIKKPANATGKFMLEEQTINYIYQAKLDVTSDYSSGNNSTLRTKNKLPLPLTGDLQSNLILGFGLLLALFGSICLYKNKRKNKN
ncbi:MucBP domain-containing protein [Listeria cossartiae subsp. cayugensis]|uniref:MucBP domain-containing protein n=1 Tax=Listeria cossartiae TaxID=2838249 RepID=UPI00288075C1|nr:MucBP domain-containing protein [Listeria cossartiae]MDS9999647.1 MucBP domain-containing protein [Listeria cossartiae subsp. cayugensis]MDT0007906.1 MucBP domain-containing protein [Listeria cossartiae subsp. cayugensis]MDT0013336.1 MucBP domain-containing protein [Listeria cossartiae subsp. cayugensis]MDT0029679.1 MucBP domain-containing protein [Listeria cossartiae subsp. cayugensis]MDT0037794.1 MucBP domain-containing protein [Listeria cossartiae subsp. cayugensis]